MDDPQQITLESVKSILVDKAPAESLEYIINTVNALCNGEFDVVFDLSLVRGQGYYTGTVFEVESIDSNKADGGILRQHQKRRRPGTTRTVSIL